MASSEQKSDEQKGATNNDEIIEIIDTHIHLWNVNTAKREWLSSKGLEDINCSYDINKYYSMYNNQINPYIHLKFGIFMETSVAEQDINTEIDEITSICKNPNNNLKGMIVQIDPNKSTKQFTQSFNELKQNPYIVGIRKVLLNHGYKNDEIPQQFIDNLQIVSSDKDIHWPFDIVTNIGLLQGVEEMIKSLPNMIFVLNHMGNHHGIGNDDNLNKIWREQIEKLSKYKNLCIKLSALTGGQPGLKVTQKWSFDVEKERVDFVVKHFNENNIVYGCDWPVSLIPLAKNERDHFLKLWTLNLYNHLKKNYGKQFCDKVFVTNPTRIYNLTLTSKI